MPLDTDPVLLRARLLDQLAAPVRHVLDAVIERASPAPVYAVGGSVRDLLLGRPIIDVDLATPADAIDLVRVALAGAKPATTHARFRTSSLVIGSVSLDIATTRVETYPHPGDLPRVATPASIDDDLRRRDFTVNAIALRLDGDPALHDPCGGVADLESRTIRVLHDASFRDDATRAYRAFRYAARLGFEIEPRTRALIADAARYVDAISRSRLHRELRLMLLDEPPGGALEACAAAGMLTPIDPQLLWNAPTSLAFAAAALRGELSNASRDTAAFGFCLLLQRVSTDNVDRAAHGMRLTRAETGAVRGMAALTASTQLLERAAAAPSGIVLLLDRFPPPAVVAFAGLHRSEIAGQRALRYLAEWRHTRTRLSGSDLRRIGVPEGPQVRRGLQLIRAARLDGDAPGVDDERRIARAFAAGIREAAGENDGTDR